MKVLIAGGGMAGSLAALLFGRDGHEVDVIERREPNGPMATGPGRTGNFTLSERGRTALRVANLLDEALAISVPLKGRRVHVSYLPFPLTTPYGAFDDEILHSVGRDELHSLVMNHARSFGGARYHFGSTLVGLDPREQVARVENAGGVREMSYDLFIGADGVRSAARGLLAKEGLVAVERLPSDWCYAERQSERAVRPGERNYLQVWPKPNGVVCGLPMRDGTLLLNHLFNKSEPHDPRAVYEIERLRVDPWFVGDATVLIGDAAHSMSPFMGQGMNMALEDAAALATLVRARGVCERTLMTFQSRRRPISDALTEMSESHSVTLARKLQNPAFILGQHLRAIGRRAFPSLFRETDYNAWTRSALTPEPGH